MTIRVCCVVAVFIFVTGLSASSSADGIIYHQEVSSAVALEPLTLEAIVEVEAATVTSASIYYRVRGQSVYLEAPMSSAGGNLYFGTIPAGDITEAGLEYYLIAILDDGSVIGYPADDPGVAPVQVVVRQSVEEAAAVDPFQDITVEGEELTAIILSPEPREFYLPEDVVIGVSLFNIQDLDESSIRLLIDGQDVTAQAEVSMDLVTYSPPGLISGAHQVEVHMNKTSGAAYTPLAWRFLVTEKATLTTERAFNHSGRITPAYENNNVDEQVLEVSSLRVSYRGGWDWLKFRSNLKLTSEEDPYKPPRNRYSINFQTPLLKLGLGDVTPRINRFGMDGKRLRGYDANLTLGFFNLRVAQGELERVIQGRPEAAYEVTEYNAVADSLSISRAGYTFRRDVVAIRPSFGDGEKFELAFSVIKAKDKIPTVDRVITDAIVTIDSADAADDGFTGANWIDETAGTIKYRDLVSHLGTQNVFLDTAFWEGKSPEDNLVIGTDLSLAFNQRRFVIQSGFSLSMLNKNIWDPVLTLDDLDTFAPGDTLEDGMVLESIDLAGFPDPADFEQYFHMNLNQVPLVPIATDEEALGNPLQLVAKMPSLAYYASTKLNYLRNFITLEYQQVGPQYNSLANPNLQKNVRIRTISDRIRLFRNKLFLTAAYRKTDDDIVKNEGDPITTTKTTNLSANVNLGMGLPTLTLGQRIYERNNGIDSLDITEIDGEQQRRDRREHSQTKAINLGLTYRLQLLTSTHDLSLSLNTTDISDLVTDRPEDDPLLVIPTATSRILSLGVTSRFSDRLETQVALATNDSEIGEDTSLVVQNIVNAELMARLRLMGGKLRVRGGFSLTTSETNQDENALAPPPFTRTGLKGGVSYQLIENLNMVTDFKFQNKEVEVGGTMESLPNTRIAARLEYTF